MLWISWLALGCSGTTPDPGTDELALQQRVLAAIHSDIVDREYADFESKTATLAQTIASFCEAPTEQGLAGSQDAWVAARQPFKRMEVVGFGPIVDEPSRFGPLIDFWPVRNTVVDDLLASTDGVTATDVAIMGSSSRGLPVLEYLLWHPEHGLISDFEDPRRCEYLTSVAQDLATSATGLHSAWVDYTVMLDSPADHDDLIYASTQEVLNEWVNRLLFAIDNIRAEKLGKPLGDDNQGVAIPESVESPFSERSVSDAQEVFAGVELVLDGRNPGGGILDLMTDDRTPIGFREDMAAARDAARQALQDLQSPLQTTLVEQPETVIAAQDALREVQVLIQVDLAQALAVPLAFNDNDGD